MGFYPVEVVVNDARRHDVPVLRPDIHRSYTICSLEPSSMSGFAIRLGFRFVKGVGKVGGERIEAAWEAGPFRDLRDFCRRTRLPRRAVEHLILVGAMDEWGLINVVVSPAVYERYRPVWRRCRLLVVTGAVERRQGVVNVIAHYVRGILPADFG